MSYSRIISMVFLATLLHLAFAAGTASAGSTSSAGIRNKIVDRISADPTFGPHNLDIDARSGVVTLSGEVSSEEGSIKLINFAKAAPGVRSVSDQLTVSPIIGGKDSPADAALAESVRARLGDVQAPAQFNVQIGVADSKLTLSGEADSEDTRRKIEETARNASGVAAVNNSIAVKSWSEEELAKQVYLAITDSPEIQVEKLVVTAKHGIVVLNGTGRTHRDIDHALAIALMISGVKDVKSEMKVSGGYRWDGK